MADHDDLVDTLGDGIELIPLEEFCEILVADMDRNISSYSKCPIEKMIKVLPDEPILEQLLIEVEKKKNYYFHKQNDYDYAALKSAAICIMLIMIFVYLLCFIHIHYDAPLKRELAVLIKKLEPLGITFIKGKTASTSYFGQISENTDLNHSQYLVARDLMDQICYINSNLHDGLVGWATAIITIIIALLSKPTFDRIRKFLWPQYKQRYEKYCLIEQKLRENIHS